MTELQRIDEKVERVIETTGEIRAELAELRGAVETEVRSHTSQIGALFDRSHEHTGRIAAIERDYVPQSRCGTTSDENRREHAQFRSDIQSLRISMTRIVSILGAVWTAVGIAAQVFVRWKWQ